MEGTVKNSKNIEDLMEIVISIKDYMEENMVTKTELTAVENRLEKRMDAEFEKTNSKIDGLGRRIDNEVENRAQIEGRVLKLEEVVFPV